jgi:ABC-type lipoprotein release transport system permease subunit
MDVIDRVANTPGVLHVTGSLTKGVALPVEMAPKDTNGKPVGTIMLNGFDPNTSSEVRQLMISAGRSLEPGDQDTMVISSTLAEKTGLDIGDTLALPSGQGTAAFKIVGVSKEEVGIGTDNVYVPLPAAQAMLNLPGEVNQVDALFSANADAEAVRAEALKNAGPNFKLGENQAGSELSNSIDMGMKAFTLFGVLALAMGGFVIFNTFTR